MNANASPLGPAAPAPTMPNPTKGPQTSPFGTDAVYKGYDLMVRKVATHIIAAPRVMVSTRADLVRAIGSPAVTFAASAADGAILICCPDGLPETLLTLAEPLAAAQPDHLAERFDQLDRRLDALMQDQQNFERVSDRLEAIEYTLRDRLEVAPEAEAARNHALAAQFTQIDARLDRVLQAVTQVTEPDWTPLAQMLASAETRLIIAVQTQDHRPDLTPLLDAVQHLADQITPLPEALFTRLSDQMDLLANRPVPTPDLSAHHQALDRAEAALAALAARLDLAVNQLPDPQTLAGQDQTLAGIAASLAETPALVADLLAGQLDLTPLAGHMQALQQAAQADHATLVQQIAALSDRPQPVLDLSQITATLSDISASLGKPAQSSALTDLAAQITDLAAQPQLDLTAPQQALADIVATLSTQHDTLLTTLGQPAQTDLLNSLAAQITTLAARPQLDLTAPQQALADMAATLSAQHDLLMNVGHPAQTDALTSLAAQITDLAARPQLDLTAPQQALADIAATLSAQHDCLISLGQPAQADALTDLAQQITDLAARPQLDLTAPQQALTDIAATLSAQQDCLINLGQPAQTDALTDLAQQITDLATRPQLDLTAPQQALTDIAATLSTQHDWLINLGQPAQTDALTSLAQQITDLTARPQLDLTAPQQALADITEALSALSRQIGSLHPATAPEMAAQFDAVLMTLGQPAQGGAVGEGLAALAAQVARLADRPLPMLDLSGLQLHAPDQTEQTQLLSMLAQRVDAVADALAQNPDQTVLTSGFDAVLAAISDLPQPQVHIPDLTPLLARIEHGVTALGQPAQHTAVTQALADLSDHIAALAQRPDPVIDLTAQHQSFARFGTALGNAVERLETVADAVAQGADLTPILTRLDSLRQPAPHIETALADLAAQIAALPHSAPQDQGPHWAAVTVGLARLTHSVENAADIPALLHALPDHSATLAALSAQLADLAARPEPDLTEALLPLESALHRMAVAQDPVLAGLDALHQAGGHLSDQIATLVNRADLAPDMADQKQNLNDFARAMADLVQWLDHLTQGLSSGTDFSPLLAEFDLLRADLTLHDQSASLEGLSAQIADLAKSPDSFVSLAEQRRSSASFSNALGFMMQRLDALQGTMPDGQPAQHPPLDDVTATLSTLVLRLEFLLAGLTPAPLPTQQTTAAEPDHPAQSVHDLANATTALVQVVQVLEAGIIGPHLPTASATLAQVFDRLDTALDAGVATDSPAVLAALAPLAQVLHLTVQPGQQAALLQRLRGDFAEQMARTLQAQTDAV